MMRRLRLNAYNVRPCASTTIISLNLAFVADRTVGAAELAASAIAANIATTASVTAPTTQLAGARADATALPAVTLD